MGLASTNLIGAPGYKWGIGSQNSKDPSTTIPTTTSDDPESQLASATSYKNDVNTYDSDAAAFATNEGNVAIPSVTFILSLVIGLTTSVPNPTVVNANKLASTRTSTCHPNLIPVCHNVWGSLWKCMATTNLSRSIASGVPTIVSANACSCHPNYEPRSAGIGLLWVKDEQSVGVSMNIVGQCSKCQ